MAGLGVNWSWSPEYNDWYYVTQNTYGQSRLRIPALLALVQERR